MLRNYVMLSVGLALVALAFRVEGGLREVSPDEADLVQGAACPYQGLNPKMVCGLGATSGDCWWGGTQPCNVNQCKIVCQVSEQQKATAGCSWGLPICSTVPCVPATSTTVACYARFWNQETCNSAYGCYCGSPTTRVNCPTAETYTRWDSCP